MASIIFMPMCSNCASILFTKIDYNDPNTNIRL